MIVLGFAFPIDDSIRFNENQKTQRMCLLAMVWYACACNGYAIGKECTSVKLCSVLFIRQYEKRKVHDEMCKHLVIQRENASRKNTNIYLHLKLPLLARGARRLKRRRKKVKTQTTMQFIVELIYTIAFHLARAFT